MVGVVNVSTDKIERPISCSNHVPNSSNFNSYFIYTTVYWTLLVRIKCQISILYDLNGSYSALYSCLQLLLKFPISVKPWEGLACLGVRVLKN